MKTQLQYTIKRRLLTYGFAILVTIIAIEIKILLKPIFGNESTFLLFYPAVTLSAWYGGLRTGILTSILSSLALDFFFLSSYHFNTQPLTLIQIAIFLLEGILLSYAIEKYKQTDTVLGYKNREKEYNQLLQDAHKKYEKAQTEIRARDEFLSIASHELKTPLTSMLLQIQTILYSVKNVSLAQFSVTNLVKMLESAEQQSQRLARMINDLLNVSLITTGRLELETEKADLTQITKDVVERFQPRAGQEGYKIEMFPAESTIGIFDRLRMEQAISNLISNAMKYGNKKPIEVTVEKQGTHARITVTDHGIGIPQEQKERIFARFERAVNHKSYQGLGVGLYITAQILKAHQGNIEVDSKQNKGSTFILSFPINK